MNIEADPIIVAKLREAAINGAQIPQLIGILNNELPPKRRGLLLIIFYFKEVFGIPLQLTKQLDGWPTCMSEEQVDTLLMPYVLQAINQTSSE